MNTNDSLMICGAGPVGLLLGHLLAQRGVPITLLEQRLERPTASMAIGITPPSLKLLEPLGLTQPFLDRGLAVQNASVYEDGRHVGDLSFETLHGDYPFILSLPQSETIEILENDLVHKPNVTLKRGFRVDDITSHSDHVEMKIWNEQQGCHETLTTSYLIACDGVNSQVRKQAGIRTQEKPYSQDFLMADFEDQSDLGQRACLFFTPTGSVESFPLPHQHRRWIVQLDGLPKNQLYHTNLVEQLVQERCQRTLSPEGKRFESRFSVKKMLARQYYRERVILCGDAAHAMSPVGGQGMNTGFADAALLAEVLPQIIHDESQHNRLLNLYQRQRQQAYRVAALRAACNMWVGTRRGVLFSKLRHHLLHRLLQKSDALRLAEHFAMLTIPQQSQLTLTP